MNAVDRSIRRMQSLLVARGARGVQHGRRTLFTHLNATEKILSAWHQPEAVRLAGLAHSVYSTRHFQHRLVPLEDRPVVRNIVGDRAERLAYLFCAIDRAELLRPRDPNFSSTFLTDRFSGGCLEVERVEIGALLAISLANLAEQSCRNDRAPASWLSEASRIAHTSRELCDPVIPVFDQSRFEFDGVAEERLLDGYLALFEGEFDTCDQRGAAFLVAAPVGEPLVIMSFHAASVGLVERARSLAAAGLAMMETWRTPWDKRLSYKRWVELATALASVRGPVSEKLRVPAERRGLDPEQIYATVMNSNAPDTAEKAIAVPARVHFVASADLVPLPARFQEYLAQIAASGGSRNAFLRYPQLSERATYDPAEIPLARELTAAAHLIIAEFEQFDRSRFHSERESIARTGDWDIITLFERGRLIEENARHCPLTAKIILSHGAIPTSAGLAYFSKLKPGTEIAPHRGPTNLRIRCHLGIKVPANVGIRVDGLDIRCDEERCIVFNDFLTHEAWNRDTRDRIVLVVDAWHPNLSAGEILLLEGLQRYAFAEAQSLMAYWSGNERARTWR